MLFSSGSYHQWFFYIAPAGGWDNHLTSGLAAVTVIMSAVAACLLSVILISRKQHQMLLLSLVPQAVVERVLKDTKFEIDAKYDNACNAFESTGTPADKILDMMSQLLSGITPSLQDVILVRTAMMQSFDLYAPIGIAQRILATVADVSAGCAFDLYQKICVVQSAKLFGDARHNYLTKNRHITGVFESHISVSLEYCLCGWIKCECL